MTSTDETAREIRAGLAARVRAYLRGAEDQAAAIAAAMERHGPALRRRLGSDLVAVECVEMLLDERDKVMALASDCDIIVGTPAEALEAALSGTQAIIAANRLKADALNAAQAEILDVRALVGEEEGETLRETVERVIEARAYVAQARIAELERQIAAMDAYDSASRISRLKSGLEQAQAIARERAVVADKLRSEVDDARAERDYLSERAEMLSRILHGATRAVSALSESIWSAVDADGEVPF